jgi:hypothetical protein
MFAARTHFVCALVLILIGVAGASAQSSSFTYQGRLTDGGTPANGNYDLQFALWDNVSGGTQVGSTLTLSPVAVSNGVFTVSLDFGANSFPGASRFLEIAARTIGAGSFTLLTPRQQVTSTPYAMRSANASSADALSNACAGCVQDAQINSVSGSKVSGPVSSATNATSASNATNATNAITATNATQLGGIAANQYVQTNDSRLSDARTPAAGSSNYIQANPGAAQNGNFNISGNGTAGGALSGNVVNAAAQYNIGGSRFLSASSVANSTFIGLGAGTNGAANTFVGTSAGAAMVNGGTNSFFGAFAGKATTNGVANSFFGSDAGENNTTGGNNSFFGTRAGAANTTGFNNSFFGLGAGLVNTNGQDNSFFGAGAGNNNTTGNKNNFFGSSAGQNNSTGVSNNFFGFNAGFFNTTGSSNSFFGDTAGSSNTTQHDNTFIGSNAGALNGSNDVNGIANFNTFVGSRSGHDNSTGTNNSFLGANTGSSNGVQHDNTFIGANAGFRNGTFDTSGVANFNTFVGSNAGNLNTTQHDNTFIGFNAGQNTGGTNDINGIASDNTFVGSTAGNTNTTGFGNSYFGFRTGFSNTTNNENSFFGALAGELNTGEGNNFFGSEVGEFNTSGSFNNFFGGGSQNQTGSNNTAIGSGADFLAGNLTFATVIGAQAKVAASNSIVLGRSADKVGVGVSAPTFKLHVIDSASTGLRVETDTTGGTVASFGGNGDFQIDAVNNIGGRLVVKENGNVGINIPSGQSPQDKLEVNGVVRIGSLGASGSTTLCRNASNQISTCSSSLRYKTNVATFLGGLGIINRLRPISFEWKADHLKDIGLGAEEVEQVEPLLTFRNANGEIEGVKYNQLSAVFINAFKEQQAQIEKQQAELEQAEERALIQFNELKSLRIANAALDARLQRLEKTIRRQRNPGSYRSLRQPE